MAAKTFTAAALQNVARNPPAKIPSVSGLKPPTYGSRLLEIDYTVAKGWGAPMLRDYGDLVLRPQISAFHYGLVVFDHLIITRHAETKQLRMFRPDMFLSRLAKSRDYLHFATYDDKEFLDVLKVVVREDEPSVPSAAGEKYLLRTSIIGNNNNLSAGPADEFKLYSFGAALDSNANHKPLKLKADVGVRRSWKGGTGELSMGGNYANQIYHERQSRQEGFDRHLWLVDDGAITTAGDSNFFAVIKRAGGVDVVTPALDGTMMPGVVRDCVLKLMAKEPNVTVNETTFTMRDLLAASKDGNLLESFSTSSSSVTRSISDVWYEGEMLAVPVPENGGVADRMKKAIDDMQEGRVASEWCVDI